MTDDIALHQQLIIGIEDRSDADSIVRRHIPLGRQFVPCLQVAIQNICLQGFIQAFIQGFPFCLAEIVL